MKCNEISMKKLFQLFMSLFSFVFIHALMTIIEMTFEIANKNANETLSKQLM